VKLAALDVYVCPRCHEALAPRVAVCRGTEVLEGSLQCTSCQAEYGITRGIPRFVPAEAYAASFGRQWHWFRDVQLDSLNHTASSEAALQTTTGWQAEDYAGHRLLDAGVGAGRFAERAAAKGADVFGIDLTTAVDAAYENLGHLPNVHLAQADIFMLPFRRGSFDRAYSIGVLHHTPDPAAAFDRVADTVAPGGKLAIYVYSRYGPAHMMSDALRVVTSRLPPRVNLGLAATAIPLYYVYRLPAIGKVLRFALPISMDPDWRWRWLDTFDWYSPTYQAKYLYPEVFGWFRRQGFDVVNLADGPIRISGVKGGLQERHRDRVYSDQSLVAS
jgi:SAM-dependent methyltransferase